MAHMESQLCGSQRLVLQEYIVLVASNRAIGLRIVLRPVDTLQMREDLKNLDGM